MNKSVLHGFLSFIFVFALVVAGGNIRVSDAAQLWNKSGSDKGAGSYYNSKKKSDDDVRLYNGRSAKGKIGKSKRSPSLAAQIDQYEDNKKSGLRIPALFQFMSSTSVANRMDDAEIALLRQAKRKKETKIKLRKQRDSAEKDNFREFRAKNKAKLMAKISAKKGGKPRSPKASRDHVSSTGKGKSRSDVNVFNSKSKETGADVSVINQGPKIYNSR